jgi:hypothetical protein
MIWLEKLRMKLRARYDQVVGSLINFWSTNRVFIFIGIGIFFIGFIWGGLAGSIAAKAF